MEAPNQTRYLKRRKIFRTIFGIFSLSGIMFAFQACYGTPQDFGQDILVQGTVRSQASGTAVPGIKVQILESGQYTVSASDGTWLIYCERFYQYTVKFSDTDGTKNGIYQECDTIAMLAEGSENLVVNAELK